MFGLLFVIRIVRLGNGHAVFRGHRRRMTREEFEARMKREMTLKHIVSFGLPGG